MIEKFTKEEIEQIIKELTVDGFEIGTIYKNEILNAELGKHGIKDFYMSTRLKSSIYLLCDIVTENNIEYKNAKTVKGTAVKAYKDTMRTLLELLLPKYGNRDFCEKTKKNEENQSNKSIDYIIARNILCIDDNCYYYDKKEKACKRTKEANTVGCKLGRPKNEFCHNCNYFIIDQSWCDVHRVNKNVTDWCINWKGKQATPQTDGSTQADGDLSVR